MMKLKDEADIAASEAGQRRIGRAHDIESGEACAAAVGAFESAEHMEQRRFARAGGAHHRQHLAFGHRERHAPQNFNDAARGFDERLAEVVGDEEGRAAHARLIR